MPTLSANIASVSISGDKVYQPSPERKGIFEVFGQAVPVNVEPGKPVVTSTVDTTGEIPKSSTRTLKHVRIEPLPESLVAKLKGGIPLQLQQMTRLIPESSGICSEPKEVHKNTEGEPIDNSFPLVSWSENALRSLNARKKSDPHLYASVKMRRLYNEPSSLFKQELDKYERWYSEGDTESMENHITRKTRVDKYNDTEYSMLKGENELKTRCHIRQGEIIAHYGGQLLTEDEFDKLCSKNCQFDYAPEDYAVGISGSKLVLDGSYGNQMHCINDGTLEDDYGDKHKDRFNAEFFILYKETETKTEFANVLIPRVYVVATKEIPPDETLWLSYGPDFWALRQKALATRKNNMQLINQSLRMESFKSCKRVKVDFSISQILNLVLHENHRLEDVPKLLTVDKSVCVVSRMFNRAIGLMMEAVNEAAGFQSNLSQAQGIILLAEFLNISPEKLCDYVDIYENKYHFYKHVKAMLNALSDKDYPSCWHLSRDVNLKPSKIKSLLRRFIEIYDSEKTKEQSVESISRTYKTTRECAEKWAKKIKKIKAMLDQPEPHHLEKKLDTDGLKHIKSIYITLFKEGMGHRSNLAKDLIKEKKWPVSTEFSTINKYLDDISELISRKSTNGHNTLKRIGFDDKEISELSTPKRTSKKEISKYFFSLFLCPDDSLKKDQAIELTTEKFNGYTCRNELTTALRDLKIKLKKDPSGKIIQTYFNLPDKTIKSWIESLNKTSSKASTIKRKRVASESFTTSPIKIKKTKKDNSEAMVKWEFFNNLYGEKNSKTSRKDMKLTIKRKYPQFRSRKIEDWCREFSQLAASDDEETIAKAYSIKATDARRWLDNFATKPNTTIRKGTVDEARKYFFTCFFSTQGKRTSKEIISDNIRKKYPGTNVRLINKWLSEWSKDYITFDSCPIKTSNKYGISVNMAKSWLTSYQSHPRYKDQLSNKSDTKNKVCQYFEAIYTTEKTRIVKTAALRKIHEETGASIKMLNEEDKKLEQLIAAGKSDSAIAKIINQPLELVRQWSESIKEKTCSKALRTSYKVELFDALWSDSRPKEIAATARSIANGRFNHTEAQSWCGNFKARLKHHENNFPEIAKIYAVEPSRVRDWTENINKQGQ